MPKGWWYSAASSACEKGAITTSRESAISACAEVGANRANGVSIVAEDARAARVEHEANGNQPA